MPRGKQSRPNLYLHGEGFDPNFDDPLAASCGVETRQQQQQHTDRDKDVGETGDGELPVATARFKQTFVEFGCLLNNVMSLMMEDREQQLFFELDLVEWDVVLLNRTWRPPRRRDMDFVWALVFRRWGYGSQLWCRYSAQQTVGQRLQRIQKSVGEIMCSRPQHSEEKASIHTSLYAYRVELRRIGGRYVH